MILIFGLDGGDRGSISQLDMPFLNSLLSFDNCNGKICTLARGWWEMCTGRSAFDNGVWYTRQAVSNSAYFDQRLPLHAKDASFLWDSLASRGIRTGVVNVPTSILPTSTNGFFVSGSGGGMNGKGVSLDKYTSSLSVTNVLLQNNYVVDVRLKASKIIEVDILFDELLSMTESQIKSVIELQKKFSVDLLFYANMALRTVLNLFSRHIIEGDAPAKLQHFAFKLDTQIRRLFDCLEPDNWFLISDHGTEPFLFRVCLTPNVNLGWNNYNSHVQRVKRKFLKKLSQPYRTSDTFFSVRYIPGIYINDQRFGQCVRGSSEFSSLQEYSEQIREALARYGMSPTIRVARSQNLIPDLFIEKPYGCFFENSYLAKEELEHIISPVHKWSGDLKSVKSDIVGGVKSSRCLFTSNTDHTKTVNERALADLYHIILSML